MILHKDKYGNEISMDQWTRLLGNYDYKRISQKKLWNGLWVSTVWLGLDHGFSGRRELWFETMVFKAGGHSEVNCDRYETLLQAKHGHIEIVKKYEKRSLKNFWFIFVNIWSVITAPYYRWKRKMFMKKWRTEHEKKDNRCKKN